MTANFAVNAHYNERLIAGDFILILKENAQSLKGKRQILISYFLQSGW
jgi:hypothetical protein